MVPHCDSDRDTLTAPWSNAVSTETGTIVSTAHRDVFICHAREDKDAIVRPLIEEFSRAGISVWYDEAEIRWGDSISGRINEGLRISSYVVVVFTPNFLTKAWPQRELSAALNLEIESNQTKVLPLVCGNEEEKRRVFSQFPLLMDKRYLVWRNAPSEISAALQVQLLRPKSKVIVAHQGVSHASRATVQQELQRTIDGALSQRSLPVKYQPICNAEAGQVLGLEAMCTLPLSEGTLASHEEVVASAVRLGRQRQFTEIYLGSVFDQIASWRVAGRDVRRVGINLSGLDLQDKALFPRLEELIRGAAISPERLELEVAEADAPNFLARGGRVMASARKLGVAIALDNFGIAYSSLSFLRETEFSRMKLDPTLVDGVDCDEATTMLITAVLQLARSLQIEVTAQGVTRERQLSVLRNIGYTEIQGAVFFPPLEASEIARRNF